MAQLRCCEKKQRCEAELGPSGPVEHCNGEVEVQELGLADRADLTQGRRPRSRARASRKLKLVSSPLFFLNSLVTSVTPVDTTTLVRVAASGNATTSPN